MAKPFKNPVNGILPGFQVPEAVQLTFSKRYRVVVMYASLVCFFISTFRSVATLFTCLQAYQYCKLVVWQTPWRTWLRIWIDYDWFLKCTVNRSKVLLRRFSPVYHMPRPTQLTFLKASNTVSLLYGKTLQEPSCWYFTRVSGAWSSPAYIFQEVQSGGYVCKFGLFFISTFKSVAKIFTYFHIFSLYTTCLHDLSLHFCRPSYIVSLLHGKPLQERGCVFGLFFEMYSKP